MTKLTSAQIVNVFLITFIISSITLRQETKDINLLIWLVVQRQIMCFTFAMFGSFGYVTGVYLFNKYIKKGE